MLSGNFIFIISYSERNHEKLWFCLNSSETSYRDILFNWNFRSICNNQCFRCIMLIMRTKVEHSSDHQTIWKFKYKKWATAIQKKTISSLESIFESVYFWEKEIQTIASSYWSFSICHFSGIHVDFKFVSRGGNIPTVVVMFFRGTWFYVTTESSRCRRRSGTWFWRRSTWKVIISKVESIPRVGSRKKR